jgi:mannan endo-1,4-beta-mannosidase
VNNNLNSLKRESTKLSTKYYWILLSFFLNIMPNLRAQSFIRVQDSHFIKDGKPYYFLGTNFWYGMNLASKGEGGDRERLLRELDRLRDLGLCNLRIMAAGEGPETEPWRMKPALQPAPGQYNENLLDGLDFLLAEMAKRGMHAVVCLNNFWPWSGGMAQYRAWAEGSEIPYTGLEAGTGWLRYMNYTAGFYNNETAREAFRDHLRKIINRTNAYTGRPYKADPTIMAWQLANEPRGMFVPRSYLRWIHCTARLIKTLDPNHLVCVGSEGNTNIPTGNHFRKDHRSEYIDYTTIHIWVQNWGWYDPEQPEATFERAVDKAQRYLDRHLKKAGKLGKPLVLEEFGISRDGNSHDPVSAVEWRDRYYRIMFNLIYEKASEGSPVAGGNFWAWGGEGRPRRPKVVWQRGEDWTGDPPHECQGWYSVYDADESTLAVIREFAGKMGQLNGLLAK